MGDKINPYRGAKVIPFVGCRRCVIVMRALNDLGTSCPACRDRMWDGFLREAQAQTAAANKRAASADRYRQMLLVSWAVVTVAPVVYALVAS
jgi:hypothetical protein